MAASAHHRWKIWSQHQHPYKHTLDEFSYTNPRIPGSADVESALNYIVAVLYPKYIGTYATPAALPVTATANDYAVVTDDGDGKAAGYVWTILDGVVGWVKRYDMDWSAESILAELENRTLYQYVMKYGMRDRDASGFLTGDLAGQHVYGSTDPNEHLTLHANSGDTVGAHTGFIQFNDNVRPLTDATFSLGAPTYRFLNGRFSGAVYVGTMVLSSGSITDSSGAISFDNENLTTTGFVQAGNLRLDTNTLSSQDTNGAVIIDPNGNGNINLTIAGTGVLQLGGSFWTVNASGVSALTGSLQVDNLKLDSNSLTSENTNGAINITPNGTGSVVSDGVLTVNADGTSLASVTAQMAFAPALTDTVAADKAGFSSQTVMTVTGGSYSNTTLGHYVIGRMAGNQNVTGTFQASRTIADVTNTGTVTEATAGYFRSQNSSTGTISAAYSVYADQPTNTGGGTVTAAYALYVNGVAAFNGNAVVTSTNTFTVGNIQLQTNTISTTNTNGNLILSPNGTGVISVTANAAPSTDNTRSLGTAALRFTSLFISTSIGDGTNVITTTDLLRLRNNSWRDAARTQAAQAGDALFYDAVSGTWLASAPDTEIVHSSLSGLTTGDAGHTQFVMLAGRSGGQAVQGGTGASELLTLESTSNVTKGTVQTKDSFLPFTNASYSAGWSGLDLGSSSKYFRDVYTKGQFFGLRVENVSSLPAASAQNVGRLFILTTENALYMDNGTTIDPVGSGGGGGGSLEWVESVNPPLASVSGNDQTYAYGAGYAQELYCLVRVPTKYTAGKPVSLKLLIYSNSTSGNMLIRGQATLIRPGTDVYNSTTNQRTTTNSAITTSGATQNIPQAVTLDISSTTGQINSVSLAAGSLIRVRLYRDTDTSTSDVIFLPFSCEVTFT